MRSCGRKICPSEFGTCRTPTGYVVRQVFPLNNPVQFWVTESGLAFRKELLNGVYDWVNEGVPCSLPCRLPVTLAVALAWTEPPATDVDFPLRPIRITDSEALSPSVIAWTKCNSVHSRGNGVSFGSLGICASLSNKSGDRSVWVPLLSLPSYVCPDGSIECINVSEGEYDISPGGVIRVKKGNMHAPLRTHLPGRPVRVALPEGSVFVHRVFRPTSRVANVRSDMVYNCIIEEGCIDTNRLRRVIGSIGSDQTIYNAVYNCIRARPVCEIDTIFIEAVSSLSLRSRCIDIMRNFPDCSLSFIVSQLEVDCTWRLYAEVRIVREIIRKFQFDPPGSW